MHLVLLDLETTGLSPREDAFIQIVAMQMRRGAILATFVRPGRSIPAGKLLIAP